MTYAAYQTPAMNIIRAELATLDDNAHADIRTLMIDPDCPLDELESNSTIAHRLHDAMIELHRDAATDHYYAMHERSELALELSLCPMHLIDYAICFDDDDPDCATIRAHFPIHDT